MAEQRATATTLRSAAAQLLGLGLAAGLLFALTRTLPIAAGPGMLIAALGFLLLAGKLTGELLELLHLPHLTGYIAAGVLAGPHVLGFVDHATVKEIDLINQLALALIALAGGLELRIEDLQATAGRLALHQLAQTLLVLVGCAGLFMALRGQLPFARDLPWLAALAAGLLFGVLAVSRSPAAVLAIVDESQADGPVTRFSVAFVMSSNVVVLVVMAIAIALSKPLFDPSSSLSLDSIDLLKHEILGSASLGATLGLVLIVYLRLIGTEVVLLLLALGFAATEGLRYLRFDPMLTFLCAGFVVQNLSRQGQKLRIAIGDLTSVVFVVFFATAGAHLDLPLLARLWPIALSLCAGRALFTWLAHFLAFTALGERGPLRRWGFSGLLAQAGLALGLSGLISQRFPVLGAGFEALVIATIAINEIVGPVVFKLGLERVQEAAQRSS